MSVNLRGDFFLLTLYLCKHISYGGAENAGHENAGPEIDGPMCGA